MPNDPNNPQFPQNPEQPGYGQQPDYPTPQQPMYPPQEPGYTQPTYPSPEQPTYPSPQQPVYPTPQPPYPGAQPYAGQPGQPPYPGYQPQPGQPLPQQPYYPQPGQPPQQRRGRGGMIAAIVGGVILLCAVICVGGLFALGQGAASSILTRLGPTETALVQRLTPSPAETVVYQDSFLDSPSDWANESGCSFKSDGYHVTGETACFGPSTLASAKADVQVTVQSVKSGQDTGYGIALRRTSSGNFYTFEITPDGRWAFLKWINGSAKAVTDLQSSTAIQTGSGATNQLRVLAVGSNFTFYVNGTQVGSATDSTYADGRIGVVTDDTTPSSESIFTSFSVLQPNQ